MKTICIEVRVGDLVQEIDGEKRTGIVREIHLAPNGIDNPGLIAVLKVVGRYNGTKFVTVKTADRWVAIESETYREFYGAELFD